MLFDPKKLTIAFIIFITMSAFQILMMKKVPEKAGLFTLFRIVIEIAVLTALYVIMTIQ